MRFVRKETRDQYFKIVERYVNAWVDIGHGRMDVKNAADQLHHQASRLLEDYLSRGGADPHVVAQLERGIALFSEADGMLPVAEDNPQAELRKKALTLIGRTLNDLK